MYPSKSGGWVLLSAQRTHPRVLLSLDLVIEARRLPFEREGLRPAHLDIGAPKKTVLWLILQKYIPAVHLPIPAIQEACPP